MLADCSLTNHRPIRKWYEIFLSCHTRYATDTEFRMHLISWSDVRDSVNSGIHLIGRPLYAKWTKWPKRIESNPSSSSSYSSSSLLLSRLGSLLCVRIDCIENVCRCTRVTWKASYDALILMHVYIWTNPLQWFHSCESFIDASAFEMKLKQSTLFAISNAQTFELQSRPKLYRFRNVSKFAYIIKSPYGL